MKSFFIISILLLSTVIIGCNSQNQTETSKNEEESVIEFENEYMKMIAWESLSESEKEKVIGGWEEARVTEEQPSCIPEVQSNGKKKPPSVVKVVFNTSNDRFLGPIGILINPSTQEMICKDIRM